MDRLIAQVEHSTSLFPRDSPTHRSKQGHARPGQTVSRVRRGAVKQYNCRGRIFHFRFLPISLFSFKTVFRAGFTQLLVIDHIIFNFEVFAVM